MDTPVALHQKPVPAHIQQHLTTQPTSGKSIAAYCKEAGFSAWSFYSWRKRYGKQQPSPAQSSPSSVLFTALGPLGAQYRRPLFDIHLSVGTRISVYSGTTAQELTPFLDLLSCRSTPC